MGDQAALQEAIQRARQLAAKINPQNQPVKRPASTLDQSGPIKVTLAYEKPVSKQNDPEPRQRSTSRDYNRNERDRDSRDRDYKDSRENNNHSRESREPSRNLGHSMTSHEPYANSGPPPAPRGNDDQVELIIPHAVIGLVIGKGGENIKRIQNESGAAVKVDPNPIDERGNKLCTITGTKAAVEEARIQIECVIEGSGNNKRPRMQASESSDSYRLKIPASRTGAIIGKGGETIKSIKQQSGCDIELDKVAKDCGPDESVFIIRGPQDKILKARALIEARLASRSHRDGGMRDHSSDRNHNHSGRSREKSVITGANAAPVSQGQFSDLSSTYPAAAAAAAATGQQNSADMTAAWAAYFAQYSNYYNQAGVQPGAQGGMPFAGQPGMMSSPQTSAAPAPSGQQMPDLGAQQTTSDPSQGAPGASGAPGVQGAQGQQDFSDQWIEYYLANGRPDYAEQIIQMKKQQQTQK